MIALPMLHGRPTADAPEPEGIVVLSEGTEPFPGYNEIGFSNNSNFSTVTAPPFGGISGNPYYAGSPSNPQYILAWFWTDTGNAPALNAFYLVMTSALDASGQGWPSVDFTSFQTVDDTAATKTFLASSATRTNSIGNGYGGTAAMWVWDPPPGSPEFKPSDSASYELINFSPTHTPP